MSNRLIDEFSPYYGGFVDLQNQGFHTLSNELSNISTNLGDAGKIINNILIPTITNLIDSFFDYEVSLLGMRRNYHLKTASHNMW